MRLFIAFLTLLIISGCTGLEDVTVKEVKDISVKEFSKRTIALDVDVVIENPNSLSFQVKEVDLIVDVNGKSLGQTKLTEGFSISGNSSESHTVALSAETGEALKDLWPSLLMSALSQQVEVRIRGEIKGGVLLVSRTVPVDHTETVDLSNLKLNGLF